MSSPHRNQALYVGLAVAAATLVAGYLLLSNQKSAGNDGGFPKDMKEKTLKSNDEARSKSPVRTTRRDGTETTTPLVSNTSGRGVPSGLQSDKEIHAKIEELDKAGKKLFKEKKVNHATLINQTRECLDMLSYFFLIVL